MVFSNDLVVVGHIGWLDFPIIEFIPIETPEPAVLLNFIKAAGASLLGCLLQELLADLLGIVVIEKAGEEEFSGHDFLVDFVGVIGILCEGNGAAHELIETNADGSNVNWEAVPPSLDDLGSKVVRSPDYCESPRRFLAQLFSSPHVY